MLPAVLILVAIYAQEKDECQGCLQRTSKRNQKSTDGFRYWQPRAHVPLHALCTHKPPPSSNGHNGTVALSEARLAVEHRHGP